MIILLKSLIFNILFCIWTFFISFFSFPVFFFNRKYDVKVLDDGWTAVTKDKSLSAQFEHTVGITENGYEIFTKSVKDYLRPPYK